jgi:hypothetical protein
MDDTDEEIMRLTMENLIIYILEKDKKIEEEVIFDNSVEINWHKDPNPTQKK